MANKKPELDSNQNEILVQVGKQLKQARLFRNLSVKHVAQQANIGQSTLVRMKKGHAGVSIGHYLNLLSVFNLERYLLFLAQDDFQGIRLQEESLSSNKVVDKKISKTWMAVLKNKDSPGIEIVDMKAVLK